MKKGLVLKFILIIVLFVFIFNFSRVKFLFSLVKIYINDPTTRDVSDEDFDTNDKNPLKDLIDNEGVDEPLSPKDDAEENPNPETNVVTENKDIKEDTVSLNSIASIYNEKFESLQNEFMASLDGLIESGYNEYKNGDISKSQLASKYLDLGSGLEKISDKKFLALLDEMKIELKENGLATDITKEIESYYKGFKGSQKKRLLDKAMDNM